MQLSDLFYSLGDVVAGKRSLDDVLKELQEKDKEKIKQLYDVCKNFVSKLKTNIKESVVKADQKNEQKAKYDMSSAVVVKKDGEIFHMGAKEKEKQSWWKKVRNNELSPESWRVKKVPKIAIAIFGKFLYTR